MTTEPAGLELAVKRGNIQHVLVCGHSDCKAINTLYNLSCCPNSFNPESPVDHWLRKNGFRSFAKLKELMESDKIGSPRRILFEAENPELLR